jgi:hypothetical protein
MQSAALAQLVLQAVPAQTNPPVQAAAAGVWQTPLAQVPVATKLLPEQVGVPQATTGYVQLPSERPAQVPAQVRSLPHDWLQQ